MRSAMSDAAAAFCAAVASSPRPEAAASATMRFLSDAAASDEGSEDGAATALFAASGSTATARVEVAARRARLATDARRGAAAAGREARALAEDMGSSARDGSRNGGPKPAETLKRSRFVALREPRKTSAQKKKASACRVCGNETRVLRFPAPPPRHDVDKIRAIPRPRPPSGQSPARSASSTARSGV